jgi:hypothetical protein
LAGFAAQIKTHTDLHGNIRPWSVAKIARQWLKIVAPAVCDINGKTPGTLPRARR